jgi:hypothetical protein
MNMAPQKMEAIGYDPRFGGLDLSGFPHLTPLHDESFIDDRFAPMDKSTNGSADLKAFIAQQISERTPTSIVHAGGCQFRVFRANRPSPSPAVSTKLLDAAPTTAERFSRSGASPNGAVHPG